MKSLYALLFLVIANFSFAQTVSEKVLYTAPAGQQLVDAYSFYNDDKGNYAYVEYDQTNNVSRLVSNQGNSIYYDVVNNDIKFDNSGTIYSTAYNYRKDTTYLVEKYFLLRNGQAVADFASIDSYNAFINSSNEYQSVITENNMQYIATYSQDKGLVKAGPYDAVKSIYAEMNYTGEDAGQTLFKDKNGDYGYVLILGDRASYLFGNNLYTTDYTDINEWSFTYDKNQVLSYIAKNNARFYTVTGNEFVVQGTKKWAAFGSINYPIKFTKDNVPVYVVVDSVSENIYNSRLVVGDDYYKVYTDASKKNTVSGYTGGIFDINVTDNGINFTGSTQSITKNKEGYDEYWYKTSNIINGIETKGYYNQGVPRFNKSGAMLTSGSVKEGELQASLFWTKGKETEVVSDRKYDGINDYGFINDGNKIYYIGAIYGNYEKNIKDKSRVFIDGDFIGEYESVMSQTMDNGSYGTIVFNQSGDYVFATQNSKETKVNGESQFEYTSEIVSSKDVDMPKIPYGKKGFSYIDNLNFIKGGKIFYMGYVYTTDITSEIFPVVDDKIIGKGYSSVTDFRYNKVTNSATFRGSRGSDIYNVTIQF